MRESWPGTRDWQATSGRRASTPSISLSRLGAGASSTPATLWCWRPSATSWGSQRAKSFEVPLVELLCLARTGYGWQGTAQSGVEAAWSKWHEYKQQNSSQYSMYSYWFWHSRPIVYCFDNPFCSGNACPGAKNLIGNIQLFGLVRRLLGELALLGLILPLEVWSVVSCLFLYCFEK